MPAPVYLDYAATTPVDPRVAERMHRCLTLEGTFGNPASRSHEFGRRASRAIEQAREEVATLIGAKPAEIIWTSGATESNNLALKGAARALAGQGRHIVTCATEHNSVLDVCHELENEGFDVSYLEPSPDGLLRPESLELALRADTVLVSIMQVNNEIGVIQDIDAIAGLLHERGIALHVDAAQSAGKMPINLQATPIDLMSLSAHKLYGPKGMGALFVRRRPGLRLEALIHGGGQERGLRAGTLATHQIVGMGEAFRIASAQMADDEQHMARLRDRLWQHLHTADEAVRNGATGACIAGILNVSFTGVAGEDLLMALPDIALSSGSACTSADQTPSHVLRALGCSDERADSAIRFSLGRYTTEREIDYASNAVLRAVKRLRHESA